jgi:hypothetical protein
MNENTTWVGEAVKRVAGEYRANTYSHGITTTGQFIFRKLATKWVVSHVDFTAEPDLVGQNPERTYNLPQPTLKAAKEFAEQIVRSLPNNVARRREAALKGAMPVTPRQHYIERGDTVRTPDGVGLVLGSWGAFEDVQHRVRLSGQDREPVWYPRSQLVWPAK